MPKEDACAGVSCSFDSSEGVYDYGYCVWHVRAIEQQPILISCHCAPGAGCEKPTGGNPDQYVRVPCTPMSSSESGCKC